LGKTSRGWTGARTPSAIKRVRQAERRTAINQPRRSAAKTYVANAVRIGSGAAEGDSAQALAEAMSALDRAAKVGVIHPNNAARRKSRLALKLNAMRAGETVAAAHVTKSTGTAAAVKAARTRIATAKATKAKGPQTAAGKARAALSKTARAEAAPAAEEPKAAARATAAKPAAKPAAKAPAREKAVPRTAAAKPAAKPAAKASGAKPAAKAPAKEKAAPKK
jgi:ribosomal protein S20